MADMESLSDGELEDGEVLSSEEEEEAGQGESKVLFGLLFHHFS